MRTSTDAILFYGFEYHNSEDRLYLPEFEELYEHDIEKMYAAKMGIVEPKCDYTKELDHLYSAYWERKRELFKATGLVYGHHCHSEYPAYYIAIKQTSASRGYPQIVLPDLINKEVDETKLKEFCEVVGIPYQQPKWTLCSYWG